MDGDSTASFIFRYGNLVILFVQLFSVFADLIRSLSNLAHSRLPGAVAGSTQKAYMTMYKIFLAFLVFSSLQNNQVNSEVILAFLEFLLFNNIKVAQMQNYMSTIRWFSIRFNLPFAYLHDEKIAMYFKAVQRATPARIKLHSIIDIPFLRKIVALVIPLIWEKFLRQYTLWHFSVS